MIEATLISCITGGFSVGLGCGACCSPAVGVFLSTYIVSHSNNIKKAMTTFFSFFIGKIIAVLVLCGGSSYLGSKFIFKDGYIGNFDLNKLMNLTFILMGSYLIIKWFYDRKQKCACSGCKSSCSSSLNKFNYKNLPPFIIGLAYGASPCAPLLLILGYASTLSIGWAVALGFFFTLASIISPMILVVTLAGVISSNIYEELPKYIEYFKLMCYIGLIIIGILY